MALDNGWDVSVAYTPMAVQVHSRRAWSGRDLAAERVRRGLRMVDVAERIQPKVGKSRISAIERLWRVRPELAERYLRALSARGVERADTRGGFPP